MRAVIAVTAFTSLDYNLRYEHHSFHRKAIDFLFVFKNHKQSSNVSRKIADVIFLLPRARI